MLLLFTFNPETGNFCVTLPMTSMEMPLHNEEGVEVWIGNAAHSLVTANS